MTAPVPIALALRHAYEAGFSADAGKTAVAIEIAESHLVPDAVHVNADQWKSRDRGVFQLNSHWHAEVSDADAFNPQRAVVWAATISKKGADWSPWSTYTDGAYTRWLPLVTQVFDTLNHVVADVSQLVSDLRQADLAAARAHLLSIERGLHAIATLEATVPGVRLVEEEGRDGAIPG